MGARMKGKGGAADGWEEGQGVPVTHSCRGFPVRESWSGVWLTVNEWCSFRVTVMWLTGHAHRKSKVPKNRRAPHPRHRKGRSAASVGQTGFSAHQLGLIGKGGGQHACQLVSWGFNSQTRNYRVFGLIGLSIPPCLQFWFPILLENLTFWLFHVVQDWT